LHERLSQVELRLQAQTKTRSKFETLHATVQYVEQLLESTSFQGLSYTNCCYLG